MGFAPTQGIVIGTTSVKAGTRTDITLEVPGNVHDGPTHIPITVISGKQPGPVLATVADIHDYEYKAINPDTLSGTVIAVRLAHVPAFETRGIYVNPHDRKNLNRSFPGQESGPQTERITWSIAKNVVAKAEGDINAMVDGLNGAMELLPYLVCK